MWSWFKVSRVAGEMQAIANTRDFSRRVTTPAGGQLGRIVEHANAVLAEAEKRDRELRQRLEELTDARDDAQTANQLMRRLKNELKARSVERDAALRRAEAANDAKSQFLANVSHEIRTPMHGILGLADVLARTSLEGRQQSLVQTIIRSGRGLLTIINDVLDFSKMEAGRIDISPRPFSLRVAIDDLVSPLQPRFEKKGIELIVRIEEGLPDLVVGDPVRIRQVLNNLVENGLKFTDAGYVLVDVGGTQAGDQALLVISVQDTGIGIPRDKLEAVFEKFNQVDNSSTRRHEGTGLGLTICRMLVGRMGGGIKVASTLGQGSTFTLELALPVHAGSAGMVLREEPRPAAPPRPAEPSDANIVGIDGGSFQRPRILLVEDNVVNQEVAREYLSEMGCTVSLAVNGREGVERFAAETFDLVFMDCLMPEMDGLAATRALRQIEAGAGRSPTPVVALTANAFDKDREGCKAAGMDDFLAKPFDFEALEAMVRKWLPEKQPAGSVDNRLTATGTYT